MYFSPEPSSTNYGELYPPSTQQIAERSHHTPPWGCAEMIHPYNDQDSQHMVDSTSMEPLLSFAQWQIEEDRKFYAIFPEARPAHEWQSAPSRYIESGEHQLNSEPQKWAHTSHATIQSPPLSSHDTDTYSSHTLCDGYENPDRNDVPTPLSGHTPHPFPPTNHQQHDCATRKSSYSPTASQHDSTNLPQRNPVPHDDKVHDEHVVPSHQPHHVVPSQQRPILQRVVIPSQEEEPPLMDHLPSPTSSHPTVSPRALPQEPYMNQGYSPGAYYPMEPSTYWPMYTQQQIPGLESHFGHPVHAFVTSIRPPGWPLRAPSPRIRLSPLPSKRVLEKKPPLACLFCRGRKIACGPPEPGTTEKTCNQCQRRSIKCEYPSESRRGMRTKKTISNKVNTAGPKVKLGKGPKLKC